MITSKTKIAPFGNRFLIKLDEEPEKIGSLYRPETAETRGVSGTILATGECPLGDWADEDWPPFKVGERVLVGKWAGQLIEMQDTRDKTIYLIGVEEILARLD